MSNERSDNMARPCIPIELSSRHNTKEETNARKAVEEKLKGNSDKIIAPDYLNLDQVKIFKMIVDELTATGILINLDIYTLAECSICIDRMQKIDKKINEDDTLLWDRKLLATRKDAEAGFFRACQLLGLSPQSRAKIGSINVQVKKNNDDPVYSAMERRRNRK